MHYLEDPDQEQAEHLDYLLNCSDLSDISRGGNYFDFDFSKDRCNTSQKECTREESYEEILKKINQTRLEQADLTQSLQRLKQNTVSTYLQPFKLQLSQLSQQNVALRSELTSCRTKIKEEKLERLSNRSSVHLKKPVSYREQELKKTHSKLPRDRPSVNMILKKKEAKLTESTANLGRNHESPQKRHRKRESQLTERKPDQNYSMGISISQSEIEDKGWQFDMKESISKQRLDQEPVENKNNIFVQMLQKMLAQEQLHHQEQFASLYSQSKHKAKEVKSMQKNQIAEIQSEISKTNDKLELLSIFVKKCQSEIKGMNDYMSSIEAVSNKLNHVKGRFVNMEQKCEQLQMLRQQVQQKENRLVQKEGHSSSDNIYTLSSVETLIKLFTNNQINNFSQQKSKIYHSYYRGIKEVFNINQNEQNRQGSKSIKVLQLINSIRTARRKFNELICIYQDRIVKLEEKISRYQQMCAKQHQKSL